MSTPENTPDPRQRMVSVDDANNWFDFLEVVHLALKQSNQPELATVLRHVSNDMFNKLLEVR